MCKTIYKHFKHAIKHGNLEPILVIKMNRATINVYNFILKETVPLFEEIKKDYNI